MNTEDTDPVVGHKTFHEGSMQTRHEPLRASEAAALMAAVDEAKRRRAELMPTEQDAVRAMWEAYHRLEELGWRNATYCPRDGRTLLFIEAGSSGIHEGRCDDKDTAHRRPTVWLHDAGDLWPSQPVLYREPPNTRIVAYDRRTDGRHLTLSEWVEQKRRQFEAAHPEYRKRNGESRIAFDRWLERLK